MTMPGRDSVRDFVPRATVIADSICDSNRITTLEVVIHRFMLPQAKQVSAARCARVSYLTHDGVRDVREDVHLYQRLVTAVPPHWSPLEHVAAPAAAMKPRRGTSPAGTKLRHLFNERADQ